MNHGDSTRCSLTLAGSRSVAGFRAGSRPPSAASGCDHPSAPATADGAISQRRSDTRAGFARLLTAAFGGSPVPLPVLRLPAYSPTGCSLAAR